MKVLLKKAHKTMGGNILSKGKRIFLVSFVIAAVLLYLGFKAYAKHLAEAYQLF